MTTIQPNLGKVIVQIEKDDEKTGGGIWIPTSVESSGIKKGVIMAAGEPRLVNGAPTSLPLNVGDRVILDPLGGTKMKLDGVDVILMRAEDILGKVC